MLDREESDDAREKGMEHDEFLGKASLITFLGGLGLFALAILFYDDGGDLGVILFAVTTIVAFVLGVVSRRNRVGKISMFLSGTVVLGGAINLVLFQIAARSAMH